jgi:hypothetical protein
MGSIKFNKTKLGLVTRAESYISPFLPKKIEETLLVVGAQTEISTTRGQIERPNKITQKF